MSGPGAADGPAVSVSINVREISLVMEVPNVEVTGYHVPRVTPRHTSTESARPSALASRWRFRCDGLHLAIGLTGLFPTVIIGHGSRIYDDGEAAPFHRFTTTDPALADHRRALLATGAQLVQCLGLDVPAALAALQAAEGAT